MKRERPQPNKENCSQEELEVAMRACASRPAYPRMSAIFALMRGQPWDAVFGVFGVHPRTLREWVKRFNESGIDGLLDKPRSGRPGAISPEQSAKCIEVLRDPSKADEIHWTGRKFHGYLRTELQVEVGYATVIRWIHDWNFRLKIPRPWPDRQNEPEREAFVRQIAEYLKDEQIEIWYCDETGFVGDPRPRARWAEKGQKTRVTNNGEHVRENVVGLVCPRTGEFFAIEVPCVDGVVFQEFLRHADLNVSMERVRNLLVLDNASWHKSKSLNWGRFEPVYLPGYSPDLNPIEQLWRVIKSTWFANFYAKNRQALSDRVDKAIRWALDREDDNQVTCAIRTSL